MAFVNDRLNEDEIKEYKVSTYKIIQPGAGTIDREKNMKLFYLGHEHEDFENHFFLFVCNETMNKIRLHRTFPDNNTVHWKLTSAFILPGLDREVVLTELENALKVYGLSGYSVSKMITEGNEKLNVEVDFSIARRPRRN